MAIGKRFLPKDGTFVDFGAGTGLLLHNLRQEYPAADLVGVEPIQSSLYPGSARYIPSLAELPPQNVDVISAFEVCEHLYEPEIRDFLCQSLRVLRPNGRLVISVPIMYGATVVLKTLNQLTMRGFSHYGVNDVLRSMVGIRIDRPENPRKTHKGFDFRWLKQLIGGTFEVESMQYSPFRPLPWFLNSQMFLVCKLPNNASGSPSGLV